jgi:ribosomal protein L37AE/L43A
MSKKKEPSVKVKETEYWYCERCEIDNVKSKAMCPCPRGSCEAEIVGTIKTTVEISITPKPKEAPIVPFGDVEEMRCPTCDAVTGHHVEDKLWTCIHCGTKRK